MEKTTIISKIVTVIVLLLMIIFVITISPRAMQNDTFWSIKVGEKLMREGIFGIDNFSIHEGLRYIAHHFLTDIIIYIVYNWGGFDGLYIMEVLMALVMAGVLYLLNKEISGNKFISIVMLVLQMIIMGMYISVRAQMISYILFILELLLLEKYKKKSKKIYLLCLGIIPIILANFHMGTVPFYFVILGVYILSLIRIKIPFLDNAIQTDKTRLKHLVLIAAIGAVTIFINPYFVDGVIYPFKTFENEFINLTIQEFQNFSISFDGGWSFIYIAIIVLSLILIKQKIKTGDFILIVGTLFMSFVAIRYIGLFVICSTVVLRYIDKIDISSISASDIKAVKATFGVIFAIIVGFNTYSYIKVKNTDYIPAKVYPVKAVEFLKKNMNAEDRIFNYYDWGSYLMLNNIKVYIDSRCDLYTKEYNGTEIANDSNRMINCEPNYREIIEKYNINMFVIPKDIPLSTLINENGGFEKIYVDDISVIYKKI